MKLRADVYIGMTAAFLRARAVPIETHPDRS